MVWVVGRLPLFSQPSGFSPPGATDRLRAVRRRGIPASVHGFFRELMSTVSPKPLADASDDRWFPPCPIGQAGSNRVSGRDADRNLTSSICCHPAPQPVDDGAPQHRSSYVVVVGRRVWQQKPWGAPTALVAQ